MCDLKDTSEFFQQVEENEKMFKEENDIVKTHDDDPIPHFFNGDLEFANLGTLTCSKMPKKLPNGSINNIDKTCASVPGTPNHVLHKPDGSIWIAHKEYLQQYTPNDETLNPSSKYQKKIVHMCLDQEGDILACVHGTSFIHRIGKTETTSFMPCSNCNPVSICATEIKSLFFVGIVNKGYPDYGRRAVVGTDSYRTDKTCISKPTLEMKKGNTPIMIYPISLAYTKGLLFVIDGLSREEGFRILKWDVFKNLHTYYYGHSFINSVTVRFKPNVISVTPKENIVVCDTSCNTLHILDRSCKLIAYVNFDTLISPKVISISCFQTEIHIGTLTPSQPRDSSSTTEDRLFTNHVISIDGYSEWF